MQTKTFDFKKNPFGQDFEPKFLYKSSSLNSIYQLIFEDIKNGDGIIVLSAETGMGKTLLLQELMRNLESKVSFFSPDTQNRAFQTIVNGLCNYLALNTEGKDFFENILALDNYLNKVERADSRIALVIDDAHQFDDAALKKLLMLSIAPSEERGSLQVILAGLPELESRINKIEFPTEAQSLKIHDYQLQKLTTLQVREYINKRLQAVGSKRRNLFTPDAIADIALYSSGIPSLINSLCASTLSAIDKKDEQTITKDIVTEVARTEHNLLIVSVPNQTDTQAQQTTEEKTTIEKLQHKIAQKEKKASTQEENFLQAEVPAQEKELIEEQADEPENKSSDESLKGYAWGIAATVLLLAGLFFYGPGTRFSNTENIVTDNLTAKSELENIERSDQAMLLIKESAEPGQSLENLKPLLMANKKNLAQKVLTLPGATLFQQPKASQFSAIPLPAFSVYYVYLRIIDNDSQEWLQVGLGRKGDLAGWIRADKVQDWNQGLTLAFKEPKSHDRVMLFKNKASLTKIVTNNDLETYQKLYNAASQGKILEDSPVVAIQPATGIDLHKNFYLLPIHDYEEIYLGNETAQLLQVSSISRQEKSGTPPNNPEISSNHQAQAGVPAGSYKAGITFVIDSTLSMQPFINRTRKAVATIYDSLEQAKLLGKVNFGLVAFRDNTDVVPDIEYVTRQYVNLKQGKNPQTFLSAVNNLKAADISSKDFIEDSYAGIKSALNDMNWTPYAARYIILITDAGARDAKDPLSFSRLNAERLNQLARENNAAIFVMHILSSAPQADHKTAAEQYLELSNYPGIGNLYYAVPTTSIQEFGEVIESLAEQITDQVAHINGGKKKTFVPNTENKKLAALQQKVAKLGHALELQYLQDTKNEQAPAVFKAWVLDKDFKNPERSALEVRALLTRDQLSDLHNILKQVLETAKQGQVSPKQFLNELKSLAATLVRDPKQLGDTTTTTSGRGQSLAEMGFMREYIEDLPYAGEIMNLTLEDWQSWSAQRQQDLLKRLQDKINYYQTIHDNVDLWVSLEDKSIDGDAVYPVPLDKLP